jgi:hypothetical protein
MRTVFSVAAAILVLAGTRLLTSHAQAVGTVTGQVLWTDGAPSAGTRVSAISVVEPPAQWRGPKSVGTHGKDWIAGSSVVASAVTDGAGRFVIRGLSPARYHIVAGRARIEKEFDDVTTIDSPHFVAVATGASVDGVRFEVVRNSDRLPWVQDRLLTVTGRISMKRFDSAEGGLFVRSQNSDGSMTRWYLRGGYGPGGAQYWWPTYQQNLRYQDSPVAEIVRAGEIVTISGVETSERHAYDRDRVAEDGRVLTVFEVTRGGL